MIYVLLVIAFGHLLCAIDDLAHCDQYCDQYFNQYCERP
jgi:hypothetical protein